LRHPREVLKALEGIEVVFHEAAAVGVGQSMYQIQRYVEVNTYATAKLLQTLVRRKHRVEKLVVASSMSVYGEGAYRCAHCGPILPALRDDAQMVRRMWEMLCPLCGAPVEPVPTRENKPLCPTSIYAITKRDQEEMCLTVGRAYGIPTVALRYFNVYGPRQSLANPYTGLCAIFSSRIRSNRPPVVYEDGRQSRDFVSVHDIVQANLLAMERDEANYQAFNVGTGRPTTVLEVARILLKLYGSSVEPYLAGLYRQGDIRHCFADTSLIESCLGFRPKVAVEEGFKELVQWSRDAEARDRFEQAQAALMVRGLQRRVIS
jgi:dTDP-L-rhamnose 4-epimerase